jgi:hypothetical protein
MRWKLQFLISTACIALFNYKPHWSQLRVKSYIIVYIYTNMRMYVCVYVYVCMYVCVYMHVCTYVYMHVCMNVCMYICNNVCMYVCTYVCIYMHVCMNVFMYICKNVCMYACVCMYASIYAYVCMYVCKYVCMQVCVYVMQSEIRQRQFLIATCTNPWTRWESIACSLAAIRLHRCVRSALLFRSSSHVALPVRTRVLY